MPFRVEASRRAADMPQRLEASVPQVITQARQPHRQPALPVIARAAVQAQLELPPPLQGIPVAETAEPQFRDNRVFQFSEGKR